MPLQVSFEEDPQHFDSVETLATTDAQIKARPAVHL